MRKLYFKNLKIVGKFFCLYNTSKTTNCTVYTFGGLTYFKPRKPATKALEINGAKNLVLCQPMRIGALNGFIEI